MERRMKSIRTETVNEYGSKVGKKGKEEEWKKEPE